MPNNQLISSLLELSDAIEQLAHTISAQKAADNEIHIRQLSLLVKRFKEKSGVKEDENPAITPPPKTIASIHKNGYIQNWLESKNLMVVDYVDNLKADDYLYGAVDYLADYYEHLLPFYKQLKRHQSLRKNFTHHTTRNSLIYIQNWCKMLQQLQLIDKYNVQNGDSIFIDIAEVHKATYFIYGYWLEVLLRREIAQTLSKYLDKIQSFDIISQASIIKPDQTQTELDLLLMVNGKIYWFECKSGVINEYFEKFDQHRKLMELNRKNAFLIIPQKDANIALHTRKRSGMTALYGTELEKQLPQILF